MCGLGVGMTRLSRQLLTKERTIRKANNVMRPPRSQRKTSMRKTRSSSSAQGIRVGVFATAGGIAMEDAAAAGAPEADGTACLRDGPAPLRPAAFGAKTPRERNRG